MLWMIDSMRLLMSAMEVRGFASRGISLMRLGPALYQPHAALIVGNVSLRSNVDGENVDT
jgi:hypothetical protein